MAAVPNAEPKTTSLADLRQHAQPREAALPTVRAGFSDLAGFELAQRAAKALAASSLVPQNYQGNLADCIVALELAQRIGASPLMVMQNLYIVHGRPAWSSQFLIAAVNQCGRYTALQYEWTGEREKDSWTCRAYAKDKATGERVQGPSVSIAMAKKEGWYNKNGSKWQSIPELMLMYRAATFFARTNAPELTMGLSSAEEAHEIIDVMPEGTTLDAERASAAGQPEDPAPGAEAPKHDKPRGRTKPATAEPVAEPPAGSCPYTDEVHALLAIDTAKTREEANEVVDACRGQPFYAQVAKGYNTKWAEVVE